MTRDRGVALGVLPLEDRGAFAPDAHRDAHVRRRAGQVVVDLDGVREAPGHARDHDRGREPVAEERDGRVDLGEVDLGQRFMDQLDVVPVAVPPLDVASENDLDVLGFSMAQVEAGGVAGFIRTVRAPSSRRPSPPEGRERVHHP